MWKARVQQTILYQSTGVTIWILNNFQKKQAKLFIIIFQQTSILGHCQANPVSIVASIYSSICAGACFVGQSHGWLRLKDGSAQG